MTTGDDDRDTAATRVQAEVRRAQAERDIEEVASQVEAGELDDETAAALIARYEAEISDVSQQLDTIPEASGDAPGGLSRRRLAGALLLGAAFVVAAVLAAQAVQPRQGGFITGDQAAPTDLADVTNDQMEAVIAANPDVPEVARMRNALANRYFEEGDFSSALGHYLDALTGQLGVTDRAQALGRVGWMSFSSGRTDLGQQYIEEALLTDPSYAEGTFFYGLLQLYGNDDPAAALPLLEETAARDDLPDAIRAEVEAAIADARTSLDGG